MGTHQNIDMSRFRRIAFATTERPGAERWSELAVHYLDKTEGDEKRWLAISCGLSTRKGERTITDKQLCYSLENALDLFDDSPVGRQVKAEARDWAAHHCPNGVQDAPAGAGFTGETDQDALAWLFGGDYSMRAAAAAFDMGESTLRMALRNRTQVRVPLVTAMRYFDRERFLRDLANG